MLPVINGRRLQPSEFLEYIRLNMNASIDQGITSFLPYNDPNDNFNDIQKWHSNDPLGSILHLNIDGDNGSVLLTDYNQTHWTVSTLRTPLDREHPVSGNRSWGYTQDSDGYHFYVTGADRLTSIQHELANVLFNLPFSKSDELWTGFQEGVKFFVNTHQGKAEVGLKITERPNFNKLKDYFEGRITIKQLKDLKGCL